MYHMSKFSSQLRLHNIPLCVCTTFCLSIHPLINIWVTFTFWLPMNNATAAAKSLQSCPTLCNPIDGSPPGSPVLGILQERHWSGLPFPSPMHKSESEAAQSCPTLSDPMDCSLPGSSVHVIFQATVLEWGAIAFSAV